MRFVQLIIEGRIYRGKSPEQIYRTNNKGHYRLRTNQLCEPKNNNDTEQMEI